MAVLRHRRAQDLCVDPVTIADGLLERFDDNDGATFSARSRAIGFRRVADSASAYGSTAASYAARTSGSDR